MGSGITKTMIGAIVSADFFVDEDRAIEEGIIVDRGQYTGRKLRDYCSYIDEVLTETGLEVAETESYCDKIVVGRLVGSVHPCNSSKSEIDLNDMSKIAGEVRLALWTAKIPFEAEDFGLWTVSYYS